MTKSLSSNPPAEPAEPAPSLTDVAKIDDKNLLARFTSALLIVDRATCRVEIVRRMAVFGLDPKICESLADGYAAAVREGNLTDTVSFEREILRRMKPAVPPARDWSASQPAKPEPQPQPRLEPQPQRPWTMTPIRLSKPLPTGPGNLHLFFVTVAEHHEQVAREAEQFAALCRRMSELYAPSETEPEK